MNIHIELGKTEDIDELELLYDDLNDHLEKGMNYPGWRKGIYPVRQTAVDGINSGTLYVARHQGRIIGSVILNHVPEPAYHSAGWEIDLDYTDVLVIHTFAVHPDYLKCGIGKKLIDFTIDLGAKTNIRSIRLDVYEGNLPAIRLYEKCGFKYIANVDLGLSVYGLDSFRLYEKLF